MSLEEPIPLTPRLAAKVQHDFAVSDRSGVIAALERVDLGSWKSSRSPDGRERILAAVLVLTRGDPDRLQTSIGIAEGDWRDALIWAELAQPDWPQRLEVLLGPVG